MPLTPGTRLGPYEILSVLGAGGMGEVYLGLDVRLDRHVALKILPEHLAQDIDFRGRFTREAKAVAALSHPNILTLYDFGVDHDVWYTVTEYLQGETLRALLDRTSMPWRKAVELGVLAADGLAAAHSRGIIHRDLKPENLFITSDGQLKILDFGLARFEAAGLDSATETVTSMRLAAVAGQTRSGAVMGTIGYMPPEQLSGRPVDAAADIFALGCVLYEMLGHRRAFAHTSLNGALEAVMNGPVADVCELDHNIPAAVGRIVTRCLQREPGARYQSGRDLASQLREVLSGAENSKTSRPVTSLAILPFSGERLDEESGYLSDGVTESIINNLARIGQLRVAARSAVFRYKNKNIDSQQAARELNVDAVLTGRIIQRGERLKIRVDLMDVAEGTQLWGRQFNKSVVDIFDVEEEIGREISEALRLELTSQDVEHLTRRYTGNSEAYQSYLKGRYFWNKRSPDSLTKAIEYFSRAIKLDPNYALAYCGLADSYGMLSMYGFSRPQDVVPRAIEAARKAVQADPMLAEAHASWAFWSMNYEWAWQASDQAFRRAIELNPNYATAHQWYSASLLCRGRFPEALASARTALQLDPLSLTVNASLGWILHFSRRYDEAIEQFQKTLEIDPNFFLAYHFMAMSYEQKRMYAEAIAASQHVATLPGGLEVMTGILVHLYSKSGRPDEARTALNELIARREKTYFPAYDLAIICVGLGEIDNAFAWLSAACEERSTWLTYARLDPRLDDLRSDRRFESLLRRIGLDQRDGDATQSLA